MYVAYYNKKKFSPTKEGRWFV